MKIRLCLFMVSALVCLSAATQAQTVYLSGYTRDSTNFELLPYTTVYTNKGKSLTESNENGYFSMKVNPGDTIVFTRLGYKPVKVAMKETSWDLNVLMPETIRMLNQVVVYDNYIIHGHEQIQKSLREGAVKDNSAFKNPTQAPGANNLIQTFGPGMVITGALSKLLGTDHELKKVSNAKAELIKTQVYYEVIQSMEVKEYLKGLFSQSDDDYFKSLEKFKVDYPTAVYLQSREEIVRLMVESFAAKR